MSTLWDLIKSAFVPPIVVPPRSVRPASAQKPKPARTRRRTPTPNLSTQPSALSPSPSPEPMQSRYDRMTRDMLAKYGVRVRRWRSSMSGIAWEVVYHDGRVNKLIESPRPKGPMSAAVFLHEIGHHAIGFGLYRPRCLEEYHAWVFSLEHMEKLDLNLTDAVRRRMHDSLHYAISKANRRGLQKLPAELHPYIKPWPRKPR